MIFLTISLTFGLIYLVLQLQYVFFWNNIPHQVMPEADVASSSVSVIVPARNAAETILSCVEGLLAQYYPPSLYEIILVDDHSTDETANLISAIDDQRIRLIHLQDFPEFIHPPAYKKSAITLGVAMAKHPIILVTDADCLHPRSWIHSVANSFENTNAVFQASPVLLVPGNTLLEKMQEVEMLVYMLITGSGIRSGLHYLANGANMSFSKTAFDAVRGYEGNYTYASGDDLFLVEKMKTAYPGRISFVKSLESTLLTKGKTNWPDLLKQRRRWASKNMKLTDSTISAIWLFVGLFHFALLAFFVLAVFHILSWWSFLILISCKWVADWMLLQQAARFFRRPSILRLFIPLQFLYSWYLLSVSISMVAGKSTDWENMV
jgi:cellulose synthase/poly-beta-1,6-N-acetylglucosamine synthase-like glycosyltransferase